MNLMESIFNSSDHEVITEKQLEFDLYQDFFSNGAAPNGPNAGQTEVNPDPFMTLQPQNLTFSEDEAQNNIDFILKCEFCDRIYRGKYAEMTLRKHIDTVHEEPKFLTVHEESKFLNTETTPNNKTMKTFPKKKPEYDYYSISPSHIISSTSNRTLRQNAKYAASSFQKQHTVENVHEGQKMKSYKKSNFNVGESKKYKCPHCGLESITNTHIRQHIKEVHEGKKDFACGFCEKSFSRKFNLKKHQERVHEK